MRRLAVLAAVLCLTACSHDPGPVAATPAWTLEQVARSRLSTLSAAKVTATRDGRVRVTTAWLCTEPACGRERAIAVSTDGFRTARYLRWTQGRYAALFGPPSLPPPHLDTGGKLANRVVSLAPDADRRQVAVLGGDGATLFPFERVARSDDGGATWTTHDIEHGPAMPYTSGAVVLPDGRMLALLADWSSDRGGRRPGAQHHGLWISTDNSLTRFTPYRVHLGVRASDLVELGATPAHGGVLWVESKDARLWVSRDGVVFREVRAR